MWVLVGCLIFLAVVAFLLGSLRNRKLKEQLRRGEIEELPEVKEIDTECCGQHELCEKDSLLAGVSQEIVYYDDEELDQYIGVPCSGYSEDQADEFRDVFYTMQDTDLAGWVRSLMLRGIQLPIQVKDEVLLVVGERRIH